MQEGGKLIGEGAYGCIFDPPLICKGKTYQRKGVGKISDVESAQTEYIASLKLSRLKYNINKYFLLVESICQPAPRSEQTEKDLKECDKLDKKLLPSFLQIEMPLGGKSLSVYPINTKTIHLEAVAKHILEAGTILLDSGFVHFDIHSGNVLVDSPEKVRLIDFGMMWDVKELTLETVPRHTFRPSIRQETPEISVISGLMSGLTLEQSIEATLQGKKELDKYALICHVPRETINHAFRNFIQTSWSFEKRQWFTFYSLYWSKIDAWAIGILLLRMYSELIYDPAFKRSKRVESAIRKLCWIDAGQRYDCAEALAEFDPGNPILDSPKLQQWIQKQKVQREQIQKLFDTMGGS